MSVLAAGVDIIEIGRIRQALERHGERFLRRIYTPAEVVFSRGRVGELAVRFAAKEAVSKALGVGLQPIGRQGIAWQEVEVLPDALGKPLVRLSGRAEALAEAQGLGTWAISLSHGRDQAVAFVVATA
jgi:holo-[acyl-carrier protein] synthase